MLLWNKLVSLTSALAIRSGLLGAQGTSGGRAIQAQANAQAIRMASTGNADVAGLNVLGGELRQHGTDPITGFLRDGYCRPHPADPAEHTLAGVLTTEFLEFSKAQGNDLMTPRGGFPGLKEGCKWCLCVSRWKEALQAAASHPQGEKIVPRVNLAGTSMTALRTVSLEQMKKYEWKQ